MSDVTQPADARARGLKAMESAYGWSVPTVEGAFVELTVDHLFATQWANDIMSVADRRLLVLGLLIASGEWDVVDLQIETALRLGELSPEQARHLVTFVAHYAGWPRGAKLNTLVEKHLARRTEAEPS